MKHKVKCRICEKEIITHIETFGGRKPKAKLLSDDGVLYNDTVWFCNSCWTDLIKYWKATRWKGRKKN